MIASQDVPLYTRRETPPATPGPYAAAARPREVARQVPKGPATLVCPGHGPWCDIPRSGLVIHSGFFESSRRQAFEAAGQTDAAPSGAHPAEAREIDGSTGARPRLLSSASPCTHVGVDRVASATTYSRKPCRKSDCDPAPENPL